MEDKSFWKLYEKFASKSKIKQLKETEFGNGTKDEFKIEGLAKVSRRKFLALSSASLAFVAASCTNYQDKGEIVPYNRKPETTILGEPEYYASTCNGCEQHCGILIKTREGRPIKIDGNDLHPSNKGKICAIGQASILDIYNPERLKEPKKKNGNAFTPITWDEALTLLISSLEKAKANGKEVYIISKPIYSPSFKALLDKLVGIYPNIQILSYEFPGEYRRRKAWEICYGNENYLDYDFSQAKIIVSVESNFLGNEGNVVKNIREFVARRNVNDLDNFSRFYAFESDLTLTGANADYRIPLHPSDFFDLLSAIINELLTKHSEKFNLPSTILDNLRGKFNVTLEQFSNRAKIEIRILKSLINDLVLNIGQSLFVVGSTLPAELHILGNFLNELLFNANNYLPSNQPMVPLSKLDDFKDFEKRSLNGNVEALLIFDTNPVFHFSETIQFSKAIANIPTVAAFSMFENETTAISNLVVPISHSFESWNDFAYAGFGYSFQQPVIEPLWKTYQLEDFILGILNKSLKQHQYLQFIKENWQTNPNLPKITNGSSFDLYWQSLIHDGFVGTTNSSPIDKKFRFDELYVVENPYHRADWLVSLKKSYFIGDGRYINNGWLLELPHPITKVTWDNYAAISETSAKSLRIKTGNIIQISRNQKTVEIPVFVVPGLPNNFIAIEIGFGQKNVGIVGEGVGFNPNILLGQDAFFGNMHFDDIKVVATSKKYPIASTVEHHSLNDTFLKELHKSRSIIQESTVEDYKNGKFKVHRAKSTLSIIPEVKYTGVKWAMIIDLNKCTGCGACVTACNVENNIPIVGKDQVLKSREMHWIRIDTYFSGNQDNPEVSIQPMTCQHCDDAPCENVCPVVATNHSPDGLNQMVYNRCVGTRYCSNNCPYKVRRFNFFDYRDHFAKGFLHRDSFSLLNNPEVTVRSRGVMEKCTFCVQRISAARSKAIQMGREIQDGDVKTACQEACPADAILFGDMNNPNSLVSYWRNHKLGYFVLEELNIKPNITYIAKLRNKTKEVGS